MYKIAEIIAVSVFVAFAILIAATIGGTLLWLIYPHIHALFITAAEKGILAKELGWWDSVCIVWIFGILFKSNVSTNKKS